MSKDHGPHQRGSRGPCLCLLFAVMLLGGCATGPVYKATVQSKAEGALVLSRSYKHTDILKSMSLELRAVDGMPLSTWHDNKMLADPGTRVLDMNAHFDGFFVESNRRISLRAELQAGHTYAIKTSAHRLKGDELKLADPNDEPETHTNWRMFFWVEDTASHEAVSERISLKPHWFLRL